MADYILSFTIPEAHKQRALDGLAIHYGYRETDELTGEPNPESKQDYVKRKIRQEWIARIQRAELQLIQADPVDIEETP